MRPSLQWKCDRIKLPEIGEFNQISVTIRNFRQVKCVLE